MACGRSRLTGNDYSGIYFYKRRLQGFESRMLDDLAILVEYTFI